MRALRRKPEEVLPEIVDRVAGDEERMVIAPDDEVGHEHRDRPDPWLPRFAAGTPRRSRQAPARPSTRTSEPSLASLGPAVYKKDGSHASVLRKIATVRPTTRLALSDSIPWREDRPMEAMTQLRDFLDPQILPFVVAIVAVIVGGAVVITKAFIRHRERLAMIEKGMNPDAPTSRDETSGRDA